MKIYNALLILALICLPHFSHADTTWVASGNVSGVWGSAGSPYMVHTGDITVATNDTLLVQPGVEEFSWRSVLMASPLGLGGRDGRGDSLLSSHHFDPH